MEMAAARNYFMLYPNFEEQQSFSTSHADIGAEEETEAEAGAEVEAKVEAEAEAEAGAGAKARIEANGAHLFAVPLLHGNDFGRDILSLLPNHRLPPIHTLVQLDVFNEVIYKYGNANANKGGSDLPDGAGAGNEAKGGSDGSVGGSGSSRGRTLHAWVRRGQEHPMCNVTSKYFDRFVISMSTIPPRLENMNVHDAMMQALKQVRCAPTRSHLDGHTTPPLV